MSIKEKPPVLLEHFFNVKVGFSVKWIYLRLTHRYLVTYAGRILGQCGPKRGNLKKHHRSIITNTLLLTVR